MQVTANNLLKAFAALIRTHRPPGVSGLPFGSLPQNTQRSVGRLAVRWVRSVIFLVQTEGATESDESLYA